MEAKSGTFPEFNMNQQTSVALFTCQATSFVSDLFLFCFLPSSPLYAHSLHTKVILKDVDSLLYVDTDVLFLRPVDDIWKLLKLFNSTQLAAMAPEHEIPKIGWYSRFARHPFYGSAGVNSGVMLMNLTRIRSTQFKVNECFKIPCLETGSWSCQQWHSQSVNMLILEVRWLIGEDKRNQRKLFRKLQNICLFRKSPDGFGI